MKHRNALSRGLLLLLLLSLPAWGFNTVNQTNGFICVSGKRYFEKVKPLTTSNGWYYTEGPTFDLSVASENYTYMSDGFPAQVILACNEVTVQCSVSAHGQQFVGNARCTIDNGSTEWDLTKCDIVNAPYTYDLVCN